MQEKKVSPDSAELAAIRERDATLGEDREWCSLGRVDRDRRALLRMVDELTKQLKGSAESNPWNRIVAAENADLRAKLAEAENSIAFHTRDADAQNQRAEAAEARVKDLEATVKALRDAAYHEGH